jgi:cold shock CspA family protein
MRGFKVILIGILGVLFLGGLVRVYAAGVESNPKMRSVSGEIVLIDVKLGLLQLKSDAGQDTRGITEYRINQDETRVTDPSDKKFIVIKDLLAGQHVTIELVDAPEETMARKIIAEPVLEPVLQEASGELESIDVKGGTLIIEEESLPVEAGKGGKGKLTYFVFEPKDIVGMKDPSIQPVQLELKPGDRVKVEFVVKDGKRHARSITLLSAAPEAASTTTTTTTSTTVTQ